MIFQFQLKMARLGGKGNVKLALQYQVGRAMSSKNSWVKWKGQSKLALRYQVGRIMSSENG